MTLSERMVEAAARGISNAFHRDAWDERPQWWRDECRDQARAALTAALAVAEEAGVVLAPTKPTPAMVEAAWRFANRDLEDGKRGQMEALLNAATLAGRVTL